MVKNIRSEICVPQWSKIFATAIRYLYRAAHQRSPCILLLGYSILVVRIGNMHKDFRYGLLANETLFYPGLTLHNLQYIHRTGFCTDSAGNALRCGGRSLCLTISPKGQASTHLPQPVHSFLFTMYTPLAFCVMAPASQASAHLPHWGQAIGRTLFFSTI